ncbi:MAG: M42 family metallopeptidase [bacterium]|nr:M42 family metallopeptidase [bacterium]
MASPTGYTTKAAGYVTDALKKYSCKVTTTTKGSVIAEIGGVGNPVILSAHIDTLGAMVRSIKGNGRLRITKIGGYPEYFLEGVNCTIHCRNGKEYIGTFQAVNSAVHVNKELNNEKRDDTNLEVVIDEKTFSSDDTKGLGINAGDFISIDPGTIETESGFIKSRHLDDKAGAAILLELARSLDREKLNRKVYLFFSNYEETGHGSAAGLPEDANEILAVDMGAVGDDLETDEFKVSICAKDSSGPYNYEVTTDLINLAKKEGLNYAVAIYPFYSSDASAAIYAGANLKHGLVGPGVSASHGYERIHKGGMEASYKLICSYLYK